MKLINIIIYLAVFQFVFATEYTHYASDLFVFPTDALSNSIANCPYSKSMSILGSYTLNEFHSREKVQYSNSFLYSNQIRYMSLHYILVDKKNFKSGISLLNKTIKDIPNTQDAWMDNGGSIFLSDIDYESISNYNDKEYGIILLNSFKNRYFDFGFKFKTIYRAILDYRGYGFSMDIGANKHISEQLILGISLNDIISNIGWSSGEEYAAYPSLLLSSELNIKSNTIINEFKILSGSDFERLLQYSVGYLRDINDKIALQLGYSNLSSVSIGLTVKNKRTIFSYSYGPNLNNIILGHNHYFSILLDLPSK